MNNTLSKVNNYIYPVLEIKDSPHKIYILRSENPNHPRRTYVGYTVNLRRRLRQHNGEITGGAKYTHIGRPYKLVCYIEGFPNKTNALQFEWRCHNPGGRKKDNGKIEKRFKKYSGMDRRRKILEYVLGLDKWTNSSTHSKNFILTINWLEPGYMIQNIGHHSQKLFINT